MKLKELRKSKNLVQQDIANLLEIPKSTYVNYELELTQAPVEIYFKLANFYNVSLDYLLDNPNPIKEKKSEFSLHEEELIDIYRELSDLNKEVVLKYLYILLPEEERNKYTILKHIE